MIENEFKITQFNKVVLEGKATWWQMYLPSGDVIFGDAKAKMLGYPENKFKNYEDFTKLLHPDDYKKAMKAMKDHMEGKKPVYETVYRIKNKSGKYISFYDCGQITKREGKNLTAIGFVMKVDEKEDVLKQMKHFKELIIEGEPSIVELVAKIRK